jgi:hypothetical protein
MRFVLQRSGRHGVMSGSSLLCLVIIGPLLALSGCAVLTDDEPRESTKDFTRESIRLTHRQTLALRSVCPDALVDTGQEWLGTMKVAVTYDGELVTGITCMVSEGAPLAHVEVNICGTTSIMKTARAILRQVGHEFPEGCDEGPRRVAELRVPALQEAENTECQNRLPWWRPAITVEYDRRFAEQRCLVIHTELVYFRNILRGKRFGSDSR